MTSQLTPQMERQIVYLDTAVGPSLDFFTCINEGLNAGCIDLRAEGWKSVASTRTRTVMDSHGGEI